MSISCHPQHFSPGELVMLVEASGIVSLNSKRKLRGFTWQDSEATAQTQEYSIIVMLYVVTLYIDK